MYNFDKLLDETVRRMARQNLQELLNMCVSNDVSQLPKSLQIKIQNNFARLHNICPDMTQDEYTAYVLDKIHNHDPNTLLLYMKSTSRQNIYELLQMKLLSRCLGVKLEKNFNHSLKFTNTKSFDGLSSDGRIVCQCKYIQDAGGAQDNQLNDLIAFNQPSDYENYLVISGTYGITKMLNYLRHNKLHKGVHLVTMSKTICIYDCDDSQPYVESELVSTQHYSTNAELLHNIDAQVFQHDRVIEPFVGNYDLLNLVGVKAWKCYDIVPKPFMNFECKDTLLHDVFSEHSHTKCTVITNADEQQVSVITNPPYLAKNKMKSKTYKHLMTKDVHDLYQIFIKQIINHPVKQGLVILPVNFVIGKESQQLREEFRQIYVMKVLNIFEKQMFEHTTQSVVSIWFTRGSDECQASDSPIATLFTQSAVININPSLLNESIKQHFNTHGPVIFKRYTSNTSSCQTGELEHHLTHIRINLIDPNMKAVYDECPRVNKLSDRSYMNVCVDIVWNDEYDMKLIQSFNHYLQTYRDQTYSLSLSSYREFSRKRLSFEEATRILQYAYEQLLTHG